MDYENITWNKANYQKFITNLKTFQDLKYQKFHQSLLKNNKTKLIGIRTPIIKDIAKKISKGNYQQFLNYNQHKYYEENLIHGLILGYTNEYEKIDDFLKYIDNWAVCDLTCSNFKIFKKLPINYLNNYLNSKNPWIIRFSLVLLLDYYIKQENLNYIFKTCDNIQNDNYYVKMAVAWLISICFIKYQKETKNYLKENKLDKFTFNQTINKIRDSFRVDNLEKEKLKKLKKTN
jgi:3-methyladenine DNA glycosylase AlkD